MSTYHSLHYHWVCSTKERHPWITPEWRPRFHEYIGGTVRGLDGTPLAIGGVEDHVHLLVGLKTTHCLADFSRELKKATSVWAAQNGTREFCWQEGYAVFSVSVSMVETVRGYIARQEEHHRKNGFLDELRTMLEKHAVNYDPRYLE